MKSKRMIVSIILSIAVFGLIGCAKEEHVERIPPYEPADPAPTVKITQELPEGVEEAFLRKGIKIGLLPIVDAETGELYIFRGENIEDKNMDEAMDVPDIPIDEITRVKQLTIIEYPGSKCIVIITGDSAVGGCSHI